jgi:drug/metabolite transporter (DMT)-like permease
MESRTPQPVRGYHLAVGTLWMIGFALLVAVVGALAKYADERAHPWQIVFLQNLVAFLLIAPFALRRGPKGLRTRHPYLQLMRALAGGLSYALMFLALAFTPVTETVLMTTTSPLFVPLIYWLFIREKVKLSFWPGIICGFIGIAFVLQPSEKAFSNGILLALGSGLCIGVVMVCLRLMGKDEWMPRTLFYYFGLTTLLSLGPAIAVWNNPPLWTWVAMIATGFTVLPSNICLTFGLRHGSASILSPIYYVSVLFAAMFDWMFWQHIPSYLAIIGAILVIAGGSWTLWAGRK